jgi:hypothetical protein
MTLTKFLITAVVTVTLLFAIVGFSDRYAQDLRRKEDARQSERAAFVKQAREKDAIEAAARGAIVHHDPGAADLCPPPYRMTERDGCQPARR